ncbi:MAG: FAD-binding oxidoreductase [Alphaproteobacteria bacterium]|nr:FAD-binding oxidoreductase [Alphaproteobacteria bacterium]
MVSSSVSFSDGSSSPDCIIVGAGIIGCSVAYAMAKAGYKTLNIDKNAAPGHGSTGHTCAIIRVYYSTLDGTALAYDNIPHWRNWRDFLEAPAEETIADYRAEGCLVIKTPTNKYLENVKQNIASLNIPYEEWSVDQIATAYPGIDTRRFHPVRRAEDLDFGTPTGDAVDGAVLFPEGGYISDPVLATENLRAAAARYGAQFLFNATISKILSQSGKVTGVTLADGTTIHAPIVVNVAGPHSAIVNAMAGVLDDMQIKTRALRHEVAHILAPPSFVPGGQRIFSDSDAGCYMRPEKDTHMLIGSEDPPCDPREWADPDDFNQNFTEQFTNMVMRAAQRFPDININSATRGVIDLYDVSDDWIPIYDKSALEGYYMAIGSSGNQFKNAPEVGKMMTALIETTTGGIDTDKTPLFYRLNNAQYDLDLSCFSRNRSVNLESSFSVLG